MFVGVIISPYNQNNSLPYSQMTCLVIGDETSSNGAYRKHFYKLFLILLLCISLSFKISFEYIFKKGLGKTEFTLIEEINKCVCDVYMCTFLVSFHFWRFSEGETLFFLKSFLGKF